MRGFPIEPCPSACVHPTAPSPCPSFVSQGFGPEGDYEHSLFCSVCGWESAEHPECLTADECEIRKAYDGNLRHRGWDLFIKGDWAQRFHTKREAQIALHDLLDESGYAAVAMLVVLLPFLFIFVEAVALLSVVSPR